MNLSALIESINLKEELIPIGRKNRPGRRIAPRKVTIHNTDNPRRGADAQAHSNFVRNTGHYTHNGQRKWISWHYSVDDRVAIRQVPDNEVAWHAGENGNANSIAIEICMNAGNDQDAANDRAARLAAFLLYSHGLGIDNLVQHKYWTGKNCPSLLLGENNWEQFKLQVEQYLAIASGKALGAQLLDMQVEDFVFHVSDHLEGVILDE